MSTDKPSTERPPGQCIICHKTDLPPEISLQPPIAGRNTAYLPAACRDCWNKLFVMLNDLPWLRYQVSQYTPKTAGVRGYWPDGLYFGA